ncbi:hypothetical protein GCM10011374_21400 [Kocuria dechangensis]|uniref:Uncharacterized protein n=1 Tax=Kocuria dechangensis TaxID=1176249 RepID=A0A917GW17_9MICC|nr:hypothetical protein [Kocuria dechangensis]GGG58294.1 hypothetical protein GCM10011374_21400 [Kocuria dechangensis]
MTMEKPRTDTSPAEDRSPDAETAEKPEKKGPALNIPGLVAGAATAATMSVIGGHLSVVGTVIGAALTSIVSGVALVVYSTSLEKSRYGLKKVRTVVAQRVLTRDGVVVPETHGSTAVEPADRLGRLRQLKLKPVLVSAGVILGLAFAAIFGVQALTGTELSGGTGTIQRTVTGSESVSVRTPATTAPADEQAPGAGEVTPTTGTDGIAPTEAPTTAPTVEEGAPAPEATTGAAETDSGLPATGDGAAGTQPLDGSQTGTDTGSGTDTGTGSGAGQLGSDGAAQQGATGGDAGAAPAAP